MPQEVPNLTDAEAVIIRLLHASGETFGLDLVKRSDGKVTKASVYVLLHRMEEKGFVSSRQEDKVGERIGIPRRLYQVTGFGQRALSAREMLASYRLGEALS